MSLREGMRVNLGCLAHLVHCIEQRLYVVLDCSPHRVLELVVCMAIGTERNELALWIFQLIFALVLLD